MKRTILAVAVGAIAALPALPALSQTVDPPNSIVAGQPIAD
jgi:hypothetical protein